MAVHYTKYDVVNIDGETVDVKKDKNGNTISGDNNVNNDNNNNNNNNNNSTVTTLWTGEKEYKEWSGAYDNHYSLSDADYSGGTLRIYYTYNNHFSDTEMEVFSSNNGNWGENMFKGSIPNNGTYKDVSISSTAASHLNAYKVLWIGAKSCNITKIELIK